MKRTRNDASLITNNIDVTKEIRSKMSTGTRAMYIMENIMKSRQIFRKPKLWFFKTIIRPAVIYGSEVWTLTKMEETEL